MRTSSPFRSRFPGPAFTKSSIAIAPFVALVAGAAAQSTTRESVDGRGFEALPAGSYSAASQITPDARFVVFASASNSLVPGDTNAKSDVFRRDRRRGDVVLVSLTTSGQQLSEGSGESVISADGRYVAFITTSPEIVGESELDEDVFVRDIDLGTLTWVSVGAGPGFSFHPSISADGHHVAFASTSAGIVPGDTNGAYDVFVRDLLNPHTVRVSVDSNGAQANNGSYHSAISGDGRFVAFESTATNLVAGVPAVGQQVYVRDLLAGTTELASQSPGGGVQFGAYNYPNITSDGRYVTFADTANAGTWSVYQRDRSTGQTQLVAQAPAGFHAYGPVPMSADGRYVAFSSDYDFASNAGGGSYAVFVRDMQNGTYASAAINVNGTTNTADQAGISADGRYVTFTSSASNIVIGDTHGNSDVFVRDMTASGLPKISTYCEGKNNSANCTPKISASGRATVSGTSTLFITATRLINQSNGLLFWGLGAQATPFHGGTMCVSSPKQRTPVQNSGGSSAGVDCTGLYSFPFNVNYIAANGLSAGMFVHAQYYQRDSGLLAPNNIGLSDALKFPIQL